MVRTKEGGSILGFAVVGVILAVLLVGGVAAVRQNYVNGQKPVSVPQKVAQSDKDKETAPTSVAPTAEQKANEGETSTETTSPTPTPAPGAGEKTPATTPAPTADNSAAPAAANGAVVTADLPHTGPMETLTTVLAIGMLTASAIAYVRSRHYRLPSASI